jgi:UDP-N-acetylmuramoyl-tripeptide--D-alanyl-D-alanine ligase
MKDILKKIVVNILRIEARLVLWKYKPKVITITGSVGKTSTKDAVFAALSVLTHVRKSEKSYNSEIGLPLTILGIPNGWNNIIIWIENVFRGLWLIIYPHKYPKWLVLEVGVGKPGDMRKTALWLKSDVVVITAIGETPVHIEFFNSKKHLIEEKSLLIKTLKKDGLLILNADDEAVMGMKSKTKNKVITYGFSEGADLKAWGDSIFYNEEGMPEGINLRVDEGGTSLPVFIEGVFGRNHVYASLASLAIFSGLRLNLISAITALKNYDVPPGRMRLLKGINKSLIIDDTYNSSPFASESALKTLADIKKPEGKRASKNGNRKIVVLGDMLELGRHTIDAHKSIGEKVADIADVLVVVGPRAQDIKFGAISAGMKEKNIFDFSASEDAGEFLKSLLAPGDMVLIKGSQGMRMERAVEAVLLDKENKDKLLVRQNKEWRAKH